MRKIIIHKTYEGKKSGEYDFINSEEFMKELGADLVYSHKDISKPREEITKTYRFPGKAILIYALTYNGKDTHEELFLEGDEREIGEVEKKILDYLEIKKQEVK